MSAGKQARTAAMETLIETHATELKLPTVKRRFRGLAEEATREQQTPTASLAALLEAETAERAERRERRRLLDARFPALKRLEDFRFSDNPKVPQATIAALAEGSWITDRESVILIGDSGTGKTHLATALANLRLSAGPQGPLQHAGRAGQRAARSPVPEGARPGRRPLRPHRATGPRRARLPRPPQRRRRARLPSPLRTPRTQLADRHHQPALRRVDAGLPRRPPGQGRR